MSNSLWPHGLWHDRLLCPPLSPMVCSNSCPLSLWCHPTISSSAAPFFLCGPLLPLPSIFPASEFFPINWLFTSGGFSISPFSEYSCWFPLGLTDLISSLSKGLSRVFSSTTIWKHQLSYAQPSLWSNSHISISLITKVLMNSNNLYGSANWNYLFCSSNFPVLASVSSLKQAGSWILSILS